AAARPAAPRRPDVQAGLVRAERSPTRRARGASRWNSAVRNGRKIMTRGGPEQDTPWRGRRTPHSVPGLAVDVGVHPVVGRVADERALAEPEVGDREEPHLGVAEVLG